MVTADLPEDAGVAYTNALREPDIQPGQIAEAGRDLLRLLREQPSLWDEMDERVREYFRGKPFWLNPEEAATRVESTG
jgi:hypothetical protein